MNRSVQSDREEGNENSPAITRIVRYYLACMGHEDADVSTFAESTHELDYAELTDWAAVQGADLFDNKEAQRLFGDIKSKPDKSLYLGFPCYLKFVQSKKSSWTGFFVEPLFLFPVEMGGHGSQPGIDLDYPTINSGVLRQLTRVTQYELMNELLQLDSDLGLMESDDAPKFADIVRCLEKVRPDWPWVESADLNNLDNDPPLSKITEQGIYNRAVLIAGGRSPFTRGLENELASLAKTPKSKYEQTALGQWIAGEIPRSNESVQSPALVEVLPLNSEQRAAVQSALQKNLTVITGPPGTGKSQVVTNLLINAAWQNKKVLFASKNNKAVDVVEIRLNELGPRPILLRVGANVYQHKLAEYLLSMLSATATEDDQHEFDENMDIHTRLEEKSAQLDNELKQTVSLRNRVDALARKAESARKNLPEETCKSIKREGMDAIRRPARLFLLAIHVATKSKQSFLIRLLWGCVKKSRFENLVKAGDSFASTANQMALTLPSESANDDCMPAWCEFGNVLGMRVNDAELFYEYITTLRELQQARSPEAIAREQADIAANLASNAKSLWKNWLQLQPSKLSQSDRQLLSQYRALLEMVINTPPNSQLDRNVYKRYTNLVPKVSHLLPCWAVTSLSAHRRIQFEPGYYDLVVFDEASQCDIASAMPLLYRAKRAVVIGDSKQLRHISKMQRGQDQRLLGTYGLLDSRANWAYTHNSLFDLAVGLSASEDIVNLRDHHRSHADIIEFSNRFFYGGRLRVATRYDKLKGYDANQPGVRWVHVDGEVHRPGAGGAINRTEALQVTRTLKHLLVEQGYGGSVGVVSPFRAQANLIRQLISEDHQLERCLVGADFLSDTVHKFQGDERDVMIFSPVLAKGITSGALSFLKNNGNLFNVAITRARSALLVVGDLSAAMQSDIDYYQKFAEYVQSLERRQEAERERQVGEDMGADYPQVANPEQVSDWEKILYRALYQAGIVSVVQFQVEKYCLDFAVFDGQRKLNVEVDGERYHRDWTGELCRRDQIRNHRMFELGWDVMRFWVYEVRDDLEGCTARVAEWMKADNVSS